MFLILDKKEPLKFCEFVLGDISDSYLNSNFLVFYYFYELINAELPTCLKVAGPVGETGVVP